jgi:hypothetical protein
MMGDYYGLPTQSLENAHLQLEYLAQAGPRIVCLRQRGSEQNLLAEVPDLHWATPYGEYYPRGGHRLCHAPEAFPRSYVPDNDGLSVESIPGGVRLSQPVEAPTGILKSLEIRLNDDRPEAVVTHTLANHGAWPVQLSPWAITQMRLGGVAVLPQRGAPHDERGLLPDRHVVLWPYSRWQDERLTLHDDYVLVRAEAQTPAFKLGMLNSCGWMGYGLDGALFLKRLDAPANQDYPDRSCNVEVYCGERFIELETLGPLRLLEPGQCVTHVETWELHTGVEAPATPEAIFSRVNPLGGCHALRSF